MKKLFTLYACLFFLNMNAQQWEWAFKIQNLGHMRTALADDGCTYLSGYFQDSCEFNGQMIYGVSGPISTTVLIRLLPNGTIDWVKKLNGHGIINHIKPQANDVYIAGGLSGAMSGLLNDSSADVDIFFAKISSAGAVQMYKRDGGPGSQEIRGFDLWNGKLIITGAYIDSAIFSGNIFSGPNYYSLFYSRYDANGNLEMIKNISADSEWHIGGGRVRVTSNGDIFLHVGMQDTIQFGPGDTSIFFGPYYDSESQIVQFNSSGKVIKVLPELDGYFSYMVDFQVYGPPNDPYIVRVNDNGVCNHCCSAVDISRIGLDDSTKWNYEYGGSESYSSDGLGCVMAGDITSTGQYIFTAGLYTDDIPVGNDTIYDHGMYLFKMDHDGNYLDVQGINYDLRPGLMTDIKNGSFVVSGTFEGNAYLGSNSLQGGYPGSCFLAKYFDPQVLNVPSYSQASSPVSIFPNPSRGDFSIKGLSGTASLRIYDTLGKLKQERTVNDAPFQVELENGFYFFQVSTANEISTIKIAIQ
jgi:hypothetical protein